MAATKDTILIVEDGLTLIPMYEAMVRKTGHKFESATNFDEAMQKLAQGNISAVILDKDFPEKDSFDPVVKDKGIEILHAIRSSNKPDLNSIPVLMNSATFDQANVDKIAKAAGVPAGTTANNLSGHMIIDPITEAVPKDTAATLGNFQAVLTYFIDRHLGKTLSQGSGQASNLGGSGGAGGGTPRYR